MNGGEAWVPSTAKTQANATFVVTDAGAVLVGGGMGDTGGGTVNVSTGLYLNGSAYTNPDYVFEHFYAGTIERFAQNRGASEYRGLQSLAEVEAFTKTHYELPLMSLHPKGDLFERGDLLYASVEELYLHVFALSHRVEELERQLGGR